MLKLTLQIKLPYEGGKGLGNWLRVGVGETRINACFPATDWCSGNNLYYLQYVQSVRKGDCTLNICLRQLNKKPHNSNWTTTVIENIWLFKYLLFSHIWNVCHFLNCKLSVHSSLVLFAMLCCNNCSYYYQFVSCSKEAAF